MIIMAGFENVIAVQDISDSEQPQIFRYKSIERGREVILVTVKKIEKGNEGGTGAVGPSSARLFR